jgi:small subunit ribosomal protein S27e
MTTGFIKAKCVKCNNEQMIFAKASTEVKCLACGEILSKPSGGKCIMAALKAEPAAANQPVASAARDIPAVKPESAGKKKEKAVSG